MLLQIKIKEMIYETNILHRYMLNSALQSTKLHIRGCKIIDQLYISLY